MKTKKQLQRELIAAERENVRLRGENDFLKAEKQTYLLALSQAKKDLKAAQTEAREAHKAALNDWGEARQEAKNARALADKLLYINDVLCAELQDCDRCIETVRMGLEQKSARSELLNRITGPLV